MRRCPNCGHENGENDHFCSNCGAGLDADSSITSDSTPSTPPTSQPPSVIPPPVDFKSPPGASVEEEWRMSSLGPPPKRKRPLWLMILIGLIAVCLLACVALIGFSLTDTGQEWFSDIATQAAEQATEQAN